jgi:nitroreductase
MTETTPDPALLCDAVELACRAPSLHNSQPWRWVANGSTLHLYADLSRVMTAADPQGREIYLSCGAALDHLAVAMAAAGWDADVHRFPDPHDPLHVAAIEFRPAQQPVTDECRSRADAISVRRTDRRAFDTPDNRVSLEVLLRQTVIPHHVMCDVVLDDARPRLAEASRLTEMIRQNDPSYEAELAWWASSLVPNAGLSYSALPSAGQSGHVDVARHFPAAPQRSVDDDRAFDRSMILVLSTSDEDARLEVLRCGEALSAVLLECTMAGMATCTLSHMTELAQSRELIRGLTGQRGLPQLLIRVGQAPPEGDIVTTPRRPLNEVLEFRD